MGFGSRLANRNQGTNQRKNCDCKSRRIKESMALLDLQDQRSILRPVLVKSGLPEILIVGNPDLPGIRGCHHGNLLIHKLGPVNGIKFYGLRNGPPEIATYCGG